MGSVFPRGAEMVSASDERELVRRGTLRLEAVE